MPRVANFLQSPLVKKLRKLINIKRRYGQSEMAYFSGPPCMFSRFSYTCIEIYFFSAYCCCSSFV